jgi:hypothetical protein
MYSACPAFSQPLFSVTIDEHPEFVLDYGPEPRPGSPVRISRPERMPLQCWLLETRHNGLVLKSCLQPCLALGINTQGGACMVPEQEAPVWHYSEDDCTFRTATGPERWLVLAVSGGALTQWATVIAAPEGQQKWHVWPEQ